MNDPMNDDIERLLREDHDALCRDAKIPSAGLVYWRASIRARNEAAQKVEQPFTVVQGLAVAAIIGVGVALGGLVWPSLWSLRLPQLGVTTMLALVVAALVVIAPLALVVLGSRMRFDRPQD
jgi:peptidoglycan biosynthesis protein MviN/MurJ (putative lipid II flippase)